MVPTKFRQISHLTLPSPSLFSQNTGRGGGSAVCHRLRSATAVATARI